VTKHLAADIVRPVSGSKDRIESLLWTTGLVAVAIAGLLMMHGFESAAFSFTHEGESTVHAVQSGDGHGGSGVCLFVASMAGIGLAGAKLRRRRAVFVASLRRAPLPCRWPEWCAPAGRSRLIDLSVLRL